MDEPTIIERRGTWWERQSPQRKQMLIAGGTMTALFVIVSVLLIETPGVGQTSSRRISAKSMLANNDDAKQLGIEGVARQVTALERELADKDLQEQKERKQQELAHQAETRELQEQIRKLQRDLISAQKSATPARSSPVPGAPPVGSQRYRPGAGGGSPAVTAEPALMTIRTYAASAPAAAPSQEDVEAEPEARPQPLPKVDEYLPAGALISGVLITGMDAPTGQGATGEPLPVLVRVTDQAILPNLFRAEVQECFIVAAGYGELSSERAYLRGEAFSCVLKDGTVVEQRIQMIAIGEDGKAGMRGRLVSKQGSVVAKAALAGVADGIARASQPNVGFGSSGSFNASRTVESGALGGASNALDRLAEYFLDQADAMFPIIEVDAMRDVSFLVVEGSPLRLTPVQEGVRS